MDFRVNNTGDLDYEVGVSPASLTFTPITYAKGQQITVTAIPDNDTTAGTATVTATARGGGYGQFPNNVTTTMSVTVVETTTTGPNTPRAGIRVNIANRNLREGGVEVDCCYVFLTAAPVGTATVTAVSSDPGAVRVSPSSHTFNSSNWDGPSKFFAIYPEEDADARDENVTITYTSTYTWKQDFPNNKYVLHTDTVSTQTSVHIKDNDSNSAPTISSAIADQYVSSSGTGTVTLSSHFSDADSGDTLTYAAESAFPSIATVSVSGSTLTITAVKTGRTPIYVTATDQNGESSPADEVLVYVGVTGGGTLVDTNLNVGASATYDLKKKFDGPSSMTFAASSSNDTNVGTSISSGVLTVTAKAAGSATVTVTATAGSDSKTARFTVNVNRVPTVANPISDLTLANGGSTTVSLANVFSDADNDTLGLSASASNSDALTVSVSGTTLSLTAKQHTIVSVRVIANDGKSQVQDDFTVTINSAPTVANAVADAGPLPAGQTLTVNMNNVFSDADSDYFTFNVTTSDSSVATVSWSNGTLTVTGVSSGSATITMTAREIYGGSATDSFSVTVTGGGNSPPPDNNDPPPPPVLGDIVLPPEAGGSGSDFDGQTLAIKHVTSDSTGCLDVPGGHATNGKEVQTWDCNDTNAQQWTFEKRTAGTYKDSYRLVSKLGNYCLDNRGDFSTGDRMGIWSCVSDTHGAAANQSVTLAAAGTGYTITFTSGTKNVWLSTDRDSDDPQGGVGQTAVVSGLTASAAVWQIGDDDSTPEQVSEPEPDDSDSDSDSDNDDNNDVIAIPNFDGQTYEVQHVTADSTACLDVSYGTATNGQDVQTWECNDTNAQKWTFQKRTAGTYVGSYRLVSKLGNYCLDNRGDFSTSERMGIWSCVGDSDGAAANQSVTIAAAGNGYTLTFTNGSSSVWLVTDRASNNVQGDADQATVSGTAGASAIWRIVSD